jgi:hypothetical protein
VIKVGAAHRGRAQGEEAPHRGRRLGDPRGHRGGHRRRWRLRPRARLRHRRAGSRPVTRRRRCAIVRKAVVEPLRWIAENAGEPGYVAVSKVRSSGPAGPQRRHRRVRGPHQGRRHRPGQGDPVGAAQRGLDRVDGAHHRDARGGQARG